MTECVSTPYYNVMLATVAAVAKAQTVVELGTFRGQTTCRLAGAVAPHGGHVWTVDDDRDGGVSTARCRIAELELTDTVTFVVANSADDWWHGPPIDLLFCDADHTLDGLRAEWATWAPHVAPGGLVAVHDVASGEPATWAKDTFPCRGWDVLLLPWEQGLLLAKNWEGRCL